MVCFCSMWAKIITIKRTKDLKYFSLYALNLFNTRVSQFELNYWNKWTFHNIIIYWDALYKRLLNGEKWLEWSMKSYDKNTNQTTVKNSDIAHACKRFTSGWHFKLDSPMHPDFCCTDTSFNTFVRKGYTKHRNTKNKTQNRNHKYKQRRQQQHQQ